MQDSIFCLLNNTTDKNQGVHEEIKGIYVLHQSYCDMVTGAHMRDFTTTLPDQSKLSVVFVFRILVASLHRPLTLNLPACLLHTKMLPSLPNTRDRDRLDVNLTFCSRSFRRLVLYCKKKKLL